jgi:hypothetical protein
MLGSKSVANLSLLQRDPCFSVLSVALVAVLSLLFEEVHYGIQ